METLLSQKKYKESFDLLVEELENDPESRHDPELKELFLFILSTHW
jgi:hypothetical protein